MKLYKTILYVENETPDLLLDTLEALQIIDAASETFSIYGKAAKSILEFKEVELRLQNNKASLDVNYNKGLEIFDNYSLDKNILIVTIGNQVPLKVYVANRTRSSKSSFSWHIVNSTYARIGYLDRQRNLSDFIPFDTIRWLKIQIDKFGVSEFTECLKTLAD